MKVKILHLNIERDKHLDTVFDLIKNEKPDIICFEEAIYEDIKEMSLKLKYEFAFAPLLEIKEQGIEKEGSAILSKFPILKINKYRYDNKKSKNIPVHTEGEIKSKNGKRPEDRFLYYYTVLAVSVKNDKNNLLTIATTHFPVVDHGDSGLPDHEVKNIREVGEIEKVRNYLDRLVPIIRSIKKPVIFTADLNNTRGEYVYDTIAHELVDIIPSSVHSTIDPKLHRNPNLKLVVDTIMTSPDVLVNDFKIIEGVSDHKALIASLEI